LSGSPRFRCAAIRNEGQQSRGFLLATVLLGTTARSVRALPYPFVQEKKAAVAQAQHERKIRNHFNFIPFPLSLVEG
jgi:hypothetical protein